MKLIYRIKNISIGFERNRLRVTNFKFNHHFLNCEKKGGFSKGEGGFRSNEIAKRMIDEIYFW